MHKKTPNTQNSTASDSNTVLQLFNCKPILGIISRCLFKTHQLDIAISVYSELSRLLLKASSSIGLLVELGTQERIQEINVEILIEIISDALPRVLLSYALILWFPTKVSMLLNAMVVTILQILRLSLRNVKLYRLMADTSHIKDI